MTYTVGFNMVGYSPDPDSVVEFDTDTEAIDYLQCLIEALWDERYTGCSTSEDRSAVDAEMLDAHTALHNAPTVPLTVLITEEWGRIAPLQWSYWIEES